MAFNGLSTPDPAQCRRDLPPSVAELFLDASVRRRLSAGEELYSVGSAATAMYGVLDGEMRVGVTGENGKRFFSAIFGAGRWFGEVPLLDGQARVYHLNATRNAEVAVVAAADFWKIVRAEPEALLAITKLVCSRYRFALSWVEDAILKPLPARLAGRVMALRSEAAISGSDVSISQDELAGQLGVSRQSVNRQLKIWERLGIVRLAYSRVEIADLDALAELTQVPAA